jgi:hypothetical protein
MPTVLWDEGCGIFTSMLQPRSACNVCFKEDALVAMQLIAAVAFNH